MNEKLTLAQKILQGLGIQNLSEEVAKTENEVMLSEQNLENGTVLVAEEFKEGQPVFIKAADEESENLPLPVGEYTLESGDVLVVEVEGEIFSVTSPQDTPVEEEVPAEEDMVEEAPADEVESPEENEEVIEDMVGIIAALEARIAKLEELLSPAEEVVEEEVNEELSEEVVEETKDTVELSEEVNYSPEASTSKGKGKLYTPKHRMNTTRDRVFAKLSK